MALDRGLFSGADPKNNDYLIAQGGSPLFSLLKQQKMSRLFIIL